MQKSKFSFGILLAYSYLCIQVLQMAVDSPWSLSAEWWYDFSW